MEVIKGADWRTIGIWLANLLLGLIGFVGMNVVNKQNEMEQRQVSDRVMMVEFMSKMNTILLEPRFTERNYNNKIAPLIDRIDRTEGTLIDHEKRLRRLEDE